MMKKRRRFIAFFKLTAFLAVAAASLTSLPARAEVTGKVRVIDGDTIAIAGQALDLYGIDAPEYGQMCTLKGRPWRCGDNAAFALAFETAEHWVTCREVGRSAEGGRAARCRMGPYDLNALMVSKGWALADRAVSTDYVDEENAARAAGLGIWQSVFVPPWEWRRSHGTGQ